MPNRQKQQQPCNQWRANGRCTFGDKCKYSHTDSEENGRLTGIRENVGLEKAARGLEHAGDDESISIPVIAASATGSASTSARGLQHEDMGMIYNINNFPVKTIACKHWKMGYCMYGETCRYSHAIEHRGPDQPTPASTTNRDEPQKTMDSRKPNKREPNKAQKDPVEVDDHLEPGVVQQTTNQKATGLRVSKEPARGQKRQRLERVSTEKGKQKESETLCSTVRGKDEDGPQKENNSMDVKGLENEKLERQRAEVEQRRLEKEARDREEKDAKMRLKKDERERKAKEAKQRKEETARHQKEERLRQQVMEQQKREVELEIKRRNEERLAREEAEKEATRKERQEQLKALREQEAAIVEQHIVSESSLLTCGAGMDIQHVVSGFELCRITIKNLPHDVKHEEIAAIFTQQGVDPSQFHILQVKPAGKRVEAVVLANADQGEAIALGLEGIQFRNEELSFQVSGNTNSNDMGLAVHNAPFLTVSWWAPSEIIIVTYSSMEKALEQVRRLNAQIWRDRRIRVTMNECPNGPAARYFVPESIRISGCPPGSAHNGEFYDFVGSYNVRTLSNSMTYDLDDMFRVVRNHIERASGVKMQTYEVINNGKQIDGEARVKVQFDEWEDAKRLYDIMDKQQLVIHRNYPFLRCWLPKPLQYSIRIPQRQYEVQKRQWDELSEKQAGRNAHVLTKIGDRGAIIIRVLGADKKAVGSLKVRVEGMVAGEKLDTATHWHPSFAFPRSKALFERIFVEKHVHVRSDFKTQSLRVYGEGEKIEGAREMIKDEVDRLASMETTRILDHECVRGFMREGLGRLKELLGDDNVTVNVGSVPYRVTVKGGIEATHHLQRLIDEARATDAFADVFPGNSEKETCPICYDEVSNPEELGCGHTYCSGCLRHFLTSADTKSFPLLCMGNDAQCKAPIAIPAIRRFLHPSAFQNLVEDAFTSYLDKNPQELKYCTTPDCKQIYRRRTDKTLLQCPSCFATICPLCDEEAHEGMTCEERRIHRNPAEQDRLNDELARTQGFKKCPKCSVYIEKNAGCNHMTCKCGAHICWICMKVFTEGGPVYDHIHAVHGHASVYAEFPAGANQDNEDPEEFAAMQIQEFQMLRQAQAGREQFAQAGPAAMHPVHNPIGGYGGYMVLAVEQLRLERENQAHERHWLEAEGVRRYREQEEEAVRLRNLHEQRVREQQEARLRAQRVQEAAEEARIRRLREQQTAAENARRRREQDRGWCVLM